jgi:hypothetical protein
MRKLSKLLRTTFAIAQQVSGVGRTMKHLPNTSAEPRCALADELNILALVKGAERFIFVYDDVSRDNLIDTIRDLAANPQTSLSWFDANVLTRKAREQEHALPTATQTDSRHNRL